MPENLPNYEDLSVPLRFSSLRAANTRRQAEWAAPGGQRPTALFRATELGGEVGEALNVVKKLEREAAGWPGSRSTIGQFADELADVVICTDLLAAHYGVDLGQAVISKFNATSQKMHHRTRLAPDRPAVHYLVEAKKTWLFGLFSTWFQVGHFPTKRQAHRAVETECTGPFRILAVIGEETGDARHLPEWE